MDVTSFFQDGDAPQRPEKTQAPTPDLLPIATAKLTVTKTAPMPGQQGASMINMKLEKDRAKKAPALIPASVANLSVLSTLSMAGSPEISATPPLLALSELGESSGQGSGPLPLPALLHSSSSPAPAPAQAPPQEDVKTLDGDAVVSKEKVESFIVKLSTSDERRWKCKECGFVFKSKYTLEQHIETQHLHVKFSCKYCQSTYTRRYNLLNHQVTCRANQASTSTD
jgi:uncharacterized C2H2 Zn-finger protein